MGVEGLAGIDSVIQQLAPDVADITAFILSILEMSLPTLAIPLP